jgi:hypothetical protein
MWPHQRQAVTGLVVNAAAPPRGHGLATGTATDVAMTATDDADVADGAVRLSRRDLRRFRAFLHHCETEGMDAVSARLGKSAQAYARGYHAYIRMVSPAKAVQLAAAHPWLARTS